MRTGRWNNIHVSGNQRLCNLGENGFGDECNFIVLCQALL